MFQNKYLTLSLNYLFCFFPISFLLGSLIVNINLILFLVLGYIYLHAQKIRISYNSTNLALLFYFILMIVTSYLNLEVIGLNNFLKSILLLKFFFLFIVIENLIILNKLNFKHFFCVTFFTAIFLSLDLSLQFFYGKNIIGLKPHDGRIAGIFGSEGVAGAYLQKTFIFSLLGAMFLFSKNNKKLLILIIVFFLILFGGFVASNRMSFLILFMMALIVSIIFSKFRKPILISLILSLPFYYFLYKTNTDINLKYKSFFIKSEKILDSMYFKKTKSINNQKTILDSSSNNDFNNFPNHTRIYITTYKSFEEKKFMGNGYKSFRSKCFTFEEKNKKYLCSTHPHNYHLEILHDTGIIGFLILLYFATNLIYKTIKIAKNKEIKKFDSIIIYLFLFNFLIEIFPLKSTGSLFTSWNGTILWLSISIINYANQKKNFVRK